MGVVCEADVALARADAHAICCAEVGRERLRAQSRTVPVACLGAAMLGLPLVALVELLCFDVAHLLLGRVVVEGVLALLVARQHSIVVVLDARAICRATDASEPLRKVGAVGVGVRDLWAVLFVFVRREPMVVTDGGAQRWRAVGVCSKRSCSSVSRWSRSCGRWASTTSHGTAAHFV